MQRKTPGPSYKIVLMGDPYCGKSSLIERFVNGKYNPHYIQTLGTEYLSKRLEVDSSSTVRVRLFDTAGQENMKTVIRGVYKDAHGIVLVFDRTRIETLNHIADWMSMIKDNATTDPVFILVGNKSDLPIKKPADVDIKAINFAKEKEINYFTVSAKTGSKVNVAIEDLIRKIHDHHKHRWQPISQESFKVHETKSDVRSSCCSQT